MGLQDSSVLFCVGWQGVATVLYWCGVPARILVAKREINNKMARPPHFYEINLHHHLCFVFVSFETNSKRIVQTRVGISTF